MDLIYLQCNRQEELRQTKLSLKQVTNYAEASYELDQILKGEFGMYVCMHACLESRLNYKMKP